MPRPLKYRWVSFKPDVNIFKPRGIPLENLDFVNLTLDEFESIRLADYEGLYQEEAAERMNVSRQTFGNIVSSARKKIADALINGKAIKIEGGNVDFVENVFVCKKCGRRWRDAFECPECHSK
ncbi:MAG: DUF134 domain-containing protein [Brevinematia bacterium]